jgi:hypothetical protein
VRFADSVIARVPGGSDGAHNGMVSRSRIWHGRFAVARMLVSCAVTLAVVALAPVIVLVGEPVRRLCQRRLRQPPRRVRSAGLVSGLGQRLGVTGRGRARRGDRARLQRYRRGWPRTLGQVVITNPVLIALTAPGRFAIDRVGGLRRGGSGPPGFGRFGWRGGRGGSWPPPAGVREPRQPRPAAPAGAIALAEPRQQRRAIPILKALPPALSEPVRRAGSRLRRLAGALRAWPGRWQSRMRQYRRRGLPAGGS